MATATAPVQVPATVGAFSYADDLCDQLTLHMLDCDTCIAGQEECEHYKEMRARITNLGGASRPAVLSY
jgi:hypothetical protein